MTAEGSDAGRTMKMADLARMAGVSSSTVSRALADHPAIPEATRTSIRDLAAKHGYVVNRAARNLRQSQTRTIAVAVPLGHEREQLISDPFFLRLFGYLADEISQRRYDILLVREPSPDAHWLGRLVRSQRADGFIIVGQSNQHKALNLAAGVYRPLVVFGSELPGQAYCSVGSDNFEGGRLATDHLLRSGRKRLLFVGPAELPQIDLRLEGYIKAHGDRGLPVDPGLILPAHFTGTSAYDQVRHATSSGLAFDGVFAASDGIALSAIRALEASGLRCPEDVSVVGFDDSDLASQSRPALTTVRQNVPGIAAALVDHLFRRLEGQQTVSSVLPVNLVVRESAPPP
ncbi:LacI family DNA-binding transcriptional regulator [Sphingopyxis sp. Geo24]|uniref:LacI family DNA-binding transcriptional regulator n=1 Tax=Sphingopyxis sp. Geo24 TaxID=340058 RepID=UPI0024AD7A54|nr:LacI family DNA-binding transcriptional regulator [Sphingopyxis sp. Geo24]